MNKNQKKGFTIVELVTVVAVLAVLGGILYAAVQGLYGAADENAKATKANEITKAYYQAIDAGGTVSDPATDAAATIGELNAGIPIPGLTGVNIHLEPDAVAAEYSWDATEGMFIAN